MKMIKYVSAMLISLILTMGISVFAENEISLVQPTYDGSAETIDVVVKLDDSVNYVGKNSWIAVAYDTELFAYSSATAEAEDYGKEGGVEVIVGNALDTTSDKVLVTITFDVIAANKADAIGAEFTAEGALYTPDATTKVNFDGLSATVASSKPADPVPGTVGTKDGYTTVVDDDKATRFVVTNTQESIAATAASVLKVTYAGETRQANLYNLLGVEAGATGDVTIGSLTIKMVLPATVQDAASIGAYSFIVE